MLQSKRNLFNVFLVVTIAEMFSFDADSIVNEWLAFQSQNKNCEMNYCHLESLQRDLLSHVKSLQRDLLSHFLNLLSHVKSLFYGP